MKVKVLDWEGRVRVGLEGVSLNAAFEVAARWGAQLRTNEWAEEGPVLCLVVPSPTKNSREDDPARVRFLLRAGTGEDSPEVRVGPHAVVLRDGVNPDRIRYSRRRPPSSLEEELLIDLGINHLLARQGSPVLHSCAIEIGDVSVLGLGESFAGKTTVSVATMRAGGRVVSDDAVLVVPGAAGTHSLLPIRSHGWLRGRTREIVPGELREKMIQNEEDGRPRWVLNREDGGSAFVESATPNVVWIQSVDRRLKESRVESVDQGQVFAALIRASSPLYLSRHCPEIRDKLIPVFQALCAQCRGFRVRLSPRLLEAPEQEMRRLLDLSRGGLSDGELNYEL